MTSPPPLRRPLPRWLPLLGLALVLLLAWLAYRPGLSAGFLFDDFVNLNAIGATGPVDNWPAFWRYISSGTADPTGRPLALLSFLLDTRQWPGDPADFLRTNLLLHLLNGALLFALLRALGRWLDSDEARGDAAALLGAGLWLLHPLFVSTTLYIVQREAMLPATFTLLGLLAYVHGRDRYAAAHFQSGIAWMIGGIGLGTGLALLCKGNGLLLPLLAWVLDATVLRDPEAGKPLRRIRFALLVLPSIALLLWLASRLTGLHAPLGVRPWTIAQRLLTEPRVLLDYLQLLFVPRSVSTGLYNDAYLVSTGLWHPWTTLPSLLLVLALPALASWHRQRFPALAAAVLFYFAGHLLESTVIPLELYFEHRNYLPAMLLFWPLARAVCVWPVPRWQRTAVALALLALFAITMHQRATLWGKPDQLAALWARQSPASSRAQATVAVLDTKAGHPESAIQRLGPLWGQRPYDLQIAFNYANAACDWRGLSSEESLRLAGALQHADAGTQMISGWLANMIDIAAAGQCPGVSLDEAQHWLDAALKNPGLNRPGIRGQDLEPLLAKLAMRKQQPELALRHFNRALIAFTTPDVAARQASQLASSGYYRQALAHLDYYEAIKSRRRRPGFGMPRLHAKVLEWDGYWPREMAILRQKLQAEIDHPSAD